MHRRQEGGVSSRASIQIYSREGEKKKEKREQKWSFSAGGERPAMKRVFSPQKKRSIIKIYI